MFTTAEDYGRLKSAPTTQLVKQIILSDGRTISYEYDAEDRITRVEDSLEGITQYTYDAQGQLLTETRNNVVVNVMTYDKYGNILTKNGKAYVYDTVWKDKLLSCDSSVYEYDTQGNPIHYAGNRMIWEKGRQLKCIQNGQNQFLYTYNANGIRTSKTVNGVKHSFILDGAKILGEYWDGNTLIPLYDNEDNVCGILHNDIPYYFLKNLQGDVIAITNQRGETVARYTYDAWGSCTITYDATATPTVEGGEPINIATVNPFRYRSYYFDTETGLYYLQSRYYDPNLGRFLNGDEPVLNCLSAVSKGLNAFVYCNNNCVNVTDKTGYVAGVDDAAVAVVAVALIALCVVLVSLLVQLGIALSEYWVDFCHAVGNGLAWMGSAIANAAIFVWRWSTKVVKAAIAAVATSTAILKAQKKVEKRVKAAKKNVYRFFEIWFDDIGAPILGKSLSRERAVVRAKCGLNSITYFSSDARYVANRAGGAHAMWHQRHGGLGYFNHYHINKHRNSAHIYYIIWG